MGDLEVLKLVELADRRVAQKKGELLNDVQKTILQQALAGEKLRNIQVAGYSQNTVEREIAPKLWKLLSEVTEKKVGVKTVRLVLEELQKGQSSKPTIDEVRLPRRVEGIPLGTSRSGEVSLNERNTEILQQLELPGGQLNLVSAFYVERPPVEVRAYKEIVKPGSLIRIKAPKQMGKTSLMARLLNHAKEQGYRSVHLNFELADSEVFTNLDKFLQWFCATVTDELQLPIEIDRYWSKFLVSKKNCTNYFEKYLLPTITSPLALGLDSVDLIFPHEKVADDFFSLLRVWHEKAKQSDIWQNFRLVIVHGTEVYIPLSNDQSPFNVGLPIELSEFNFSQVRDLQRRHGLDLSDTQIEQLMAMVGGHPYLVRLALYKIAWQEITLEQILEEAATDTGIYADHLRLHLWNLKQHPELAKALKQVLEADSPVELEPVNKFKLNSMGLVHLQGNQVMIRYDLYRQYFQTRLNSLVEESQVNSKKPEQPDISPELGENVLAAIVFTDIKDSTQKQQENQKHTLAAIHRDLELMRKLCQQFEGQVLKSMGDGLLMYFVSAVKAVKCAQEIQKALAIKAAEFPEEERLEHRIGIHLADVFFNGIDVQGDGVNIAARLQSEAQGGGICISWLVYEAVKTHLQLQVINSDRRKLKGIPDPMLLYQIDP